MPHFKCVRCKVRFDADAPAELVEDICPECGHELDPVEDLADVVGFRRAELERWDDPGGLSGDALAISQALMPPLGGNEVVLRPLPPVDRRPQ